MSNPLNIQVAGDHYRRFKIQPIEFILANNIPFIEGNIIKYICRHRFKNKVEDLEKIKHYVDILIHEYEKQLIDKVMYVRKGDMDDSYFTAVKF